MKANKTSLPVPARIKKRHKWIEKHPLSQSDLINYGLYFIHAMESNLKEAKVFITAFSVEPKKKKSLPI